MRENTHPMPEPDMVTHLERKRLRRNGAAVHRNAAVLNLWHVRHGWSCCLLILFLLAGTKAVAENFVEAQTVNDLLRLPAVRMTRISKGLLLDVTTAGPRVVAVGEQGRIVYSDDAGASWTQAEVPVCVTLTALCFPTAQKGWAVGHDGVVLHSSDSGKTWVKQIDGSQLNAGAYAQIERLTGDVSQRETTSIDTGQASIDRGALTIYLKDLKLIATEGATWPFLDVWFSDEREGFAVGAFGMAFQSVDGGVTWEPILDRLPNFKGLHYYGIAPVGKDLFLAGEAGGLFRSEDMGKSWEPLDAPYEGTFFGIIGSLDGDAVIAYGLRGRAFRSTDRGDTWTPLSALTGASWMGASLFTNGSLLLISPSSGGVLSQDGGLNFHAISTFPLGATAATGTPGGNIVVVGTMGALSTSLNPSESKGGER